MSTSTIAMLTTIDNPFNPFTQWEQWYAYDTQVGHNTCSYIARVCRSSYDLSVDEQSRAVESAIDEIIRVNGLGLYKKVYENDEFFNRQVNYD